MQHFAESADSFSHSTCFGSLDPRLSRREEQLGTHCTCLNVHGHQSGESSYISKLSVNLSQYLLSLEENNRVLSSLYKRVKRSGRVPVSFIHVEEYMSCDFHISTCKSASFHIPSLVPRITV